MIKRFKISNLPIVILFLAMVATDKGLSEDEAVISQESGKSSQDSLFYPIFYRWSWTHPGGGTSSGSYGYIDKNGTVVVPPALDGARAFSDGFGAIRVSGQWILIDKNLKPTFDPEISPISGEYAGEDESLLCGGPWLVEKRGRIRKDGKYGFIDEMGKVVIEPTLRRAGQFSEGLAVFSNDGETYGYIDRNGKVVIEPVYSSAKAFSEGLAVVGGKYPERYYIDHSGKKILGPFCWANSFHSGLAFVSSKQETGLGEVIKFGDKEGFINAKGDVVYDPSWSISFIDRNYREGFLKVCVGRKWGFADTKGKLVIPVEYDEVQDFSEGFAAIKVGEKWGYIKMDGSIAIPPAFDFVRPFRGGLAFAGTKGEDGNWLYYVNESGKIVWKSDPSQLPDSARRLLEARKTEDQALHGEE